MKKEEFINILTNNGLKVTPQRLAVLSAVMTMKNHPSPEEIIHYVQRNNPNVAQGTIYKTLETFVEKGILKKVKTEQDFMRYDSITKVHHHIYYAGSEKIEDYFDEELDNLLWKYFEQKRIPNFQLKDIRLQIIGNSTSIHIKP